MHHRSWCSALTLISGLLIYSTAARAAVLASGLHSDKSDAQVAPQNTPAATVQLNVESSHLTTGGGSLSNLINNAAVSSHKFVGTSHAIAQVLASVDGIGTLVAENPVGQPQNTQPARLYLLSSETQNITQVSSLKYSADLISGAILSKRWMAWTDFVPNGVTTNIGVLDRTSGKRWYVVSAQNQQHFMRKTLQQELFVRDNSLFTYSPQNVDEYNMQTRTWNTYYSAPNNLSIVGFQLTTMGAVVELSTGQGPSEALVLDTQGKQIGPAYVLPKETLYTTGFSGNNVIFDGSNGTYLWTPGSHSVSKLNNIPSWLSGIGGRYVAGWGYVSTQKGQLLDLRTKQHYTFNANSALATGNDMYWTNGNTLYWSKLPG